VAGNSLALVLAGPGGIAPPSPATPTGEAINQIYWVVFAVCAIVFVLVEAALLLFVFRFRRRRGILEEAEGPQIHGNTRLEVIWTIIPAAILLGIAIFTFARTPAVQANPAGDEALGVRVEAHQFYWQYVYPGGEISLDTLYLPVDRPVRLELVSFDVNHSWWVPELAGKLDAIPGRTNVLSFTPERTGTFAGACAELCGIEHALMRTRVEVVEPAAFDRWLRARVGRGSERVLGQQTWEAACAKCHGLEGEGDVGPPIAGNGTLTNPQGLRDLLTTGQDLPENEGFMPAVGLGWPERQYDALLEFIEANPTLSGAPSGG
jgi:cytochrome c oxidase subunit 2